ncbi:ABC transporter-like protein [Aulographum hederae CBS 113979]|uniref:ABC transporter-like protein n=1 Tax=Aulographum hederae CBS 113979 TaxID=1176131 RepID=A0A6G1HGH3_9PEZI|nr:ABC transporter-like protein [Aulographum hederae CBS 113979]
MLLLGPNNTINALPQYCTPLLPCLHARLGQKSCGAPMGPFEPYVCKRGYYCPPGGKEMIICPSRSYCPEGSVAPLRCSAGSVCKEGSIKSNTWLPLAFLIIIDLALIAAIMLHWLRKRLASSRTAGGEKVMSFMNRARNGASGYKSLDDDMIALVEPRITQIHRQPTGFVAAMEDFTYQPETLYESRSGKIEEEVADTEELRAFINSLRRCIDGSQFGLSFAFADLGFHPKGAAKPVLCGITGEIKRGSLVGVLGGSGAGKSTFVNVLMGKQINTGGTVIVNGTVGKVAQYKKIIGYVPQDDVVLPELTVKENILHSARIRLPSNWSDDDIHKHVDALIACLELSHVKDSLVGSTARPVISGGQRKRVSIGMELAAAPMALFLDEPTSGLDATSAGHIMNILKVLSRLGITVVTIIHQPRKEIFETIDDLILLANGRLIYQGRESDAPTFFERAGFIFPEHANPADTIMDIITGQGRPYKRVGDTSKEALIEHWQSISQNRREELTTRPGSTTEENTALRRSIRRRGAPLHRQIYFCLSRSLLQQYRLKSSWWFEMGIASLGGFLIGLALNSKSGAIFVGLYRDNYEILSSALDYQTIPIMALLVAISIGLIASSPSVKMFGEEKLIYWREAASGHNRLAYYLGKVISTLPRILMGCLHFSTFFMLLATPRISWPRAFAANVLYFYCIYGLASICSMVTRREDGPLIATMAGLIVGILSGMAPQLSQVAKWHMTWLWRASPGVWIGEVYFSEDILPLGDLYQIEDAARVTGMVLDRYAMDLAILLVIGTVYRIIAFAELVLVKRHKQK